MITGKRAPCARKIEQFKQKGRAPGTGGAALAVWFPRAVTLASPPGKDGGDDRAPLFVASKKLTKGDADEKST